MLIRLSLELLKISVEVIVDDRDERAGVVQRCDPIWCSIRTQLVSFKLGDLLSCQDLKRKHEASAEMQIKRAAELVDKEIFAIIPEAQHNHKVILQS